MKTRVHYVYSQKRFLGNDHEGNIIYSDHYDTMIVAIPACVGKILLGSPNRLNKHSNSAMTEPSAGRNSKRSVTANFFLVDDVIGLHGKGLQCFLQDRNYLPSWDSQHIPSQPLLFESFKFSG